MAHPTMRQAKSALAPCAMIDATELAEAKGRAEGRTEGEARGEARGEANTFRKFVLAMYMQGMSAGKIAQAILQPIETIQSIIDEVKKH